MVVWAVSFNVAYKDGSQSFVEITQNEKALSVRQGDKATWAICKKLPKFISFLTTLGIGGTAVLPDDIADYNFRFTATTTNGNIHVLGGTDLLEEQTVCNVDMPTIYAELSTSGSFNVFFSGYVVLINTDYVDYYPGSLGAEASNLIDTLTSFGRTVATFTNISSEGFAAALASSRMLFIPEQENDYLSLDPAASTVVRQWVNDGGTLFAFYDLADEFINDNFNLSLTTQGEGGGTFTKTADAVGSPVENGPSEIYNNNATSSIDVSSLPAGAKSYYSDGSQSAVASIPYGNGRIIFMGWDWYDPTQNDPRWLTVLDLLTQ